MHQWLQSKKWLPEIIFTALSVLISFIDLYVQGPIAFVFALMLAIGVYFFRKWPYVTPFLVVIASSANLLLGNLPLISSIAVALAIFLGAAFSSRLWSLLNLGVSALTGLLVAWFTAFYSPLANNFYGLSIYNEAGHWTSFVFASATIIGVISLAWISGAFWKETSLQRQTSRERDFITRVNLRTSLDTAEMNERFSIARDLNELVMQRISAMLTISDGARYAAKLDPNVAVRGLERLADLIRGVHDEMRRLFDMLNMSVAVAVSPPGIEELELLGAQYRELGFPTRVTHHGSRLVLIPSAELNIYRIVFDALENVQKHAPVGTEIDVDLTWSPQGLQVLIKDNGIEFVNRGLAAISGKLQTYDQDEDLRALTQEISGPGITSMRERAQLFKGNIEARIVPGVGVTVNAIFPGVEEYLSEKDS